MRVLVIGANGQLGWELCRRGKQYRFDILPLDLPILDITRHDNVREAVVQSRVALVINAAAYTAVDEAESELKLAYAVNCDGAFHLASSCAEAGIPIIHVSTDYVFDGEKEDPYIETDPVCPMGVYGKSKAAGESKVRDCVSEYVIVRTSWLYGIHGNNFVKTILRLGREKETIRVVNDQYGCPTYAADLAEAILTIADYVHRGRQIRWGTYHYCGSGETTWYGFAVKIIDLARDFTPLKVKAVEPISTAEYPTSAKRPANSVLDCSLLSKVFGISPPHWSESLFRAMSSLFADNKR